MFQRIAVAAMLAALVAGSPAAAQQQAPSTREERERAHEQRVQQIISDRNGTAATQPVDTRTREERMRAHNERVKAILEGRREEAEMIEILAPIQHLQEQGQLRQAASQARRLLEKENEDLTPELRRALEFEIERANRIRRDYRLTEDRLFELLVDQLPDITRDEFEAWIEEGRFDTKMIDGELRFVNASRANLFFRNPEIRERRQREVSGDWGRFLYQEYERVMDEFSASAQGTVGTREFALTYTLTVRADEVAEGETVRLWMPYPQQFAAQSGVELLYANPEPAFINHPAYPQRSLYFEVPSNGTEPTVVKAQYTMTTQPRWYPVDPERVTPTSAETFSEYDYFTREQAPHVMFTEDIRRMAEEIGGGEQNPYLRARRYYDWIADNLEYSYAREYSTLQNISQYVCEKGYGDCGQLALFFIALCRASGIPARWQSGWVIYPMDVNLHDWTEIYIEPYGWIPVDPNYGIITRTSLEYLTDEQRQELRDFYFGGIDGFRFTANREHGYPHYPPKRDFRSDTVDFQRGEVETARGENLYYGRFGYDLQVDHLWRGDAITPPVADEASAREGGPGTVR